MSCVADVNTYWKSAPDMSVQTHTAMIARHYAEQVLAGEIPACRWVKLACERQLNDLAKLRNTVATAALQAYVIREH